MARHRPKRRNHGVSKPRFTQPRFLHSGISAKSNEAQRPWRLCESNLRYLCDKRQNHNKSNEPTSAKVKDEIKRCLKNKKNNIPISARTIKKIRIKANSKQRRTKAISTRRKRRDAITHHERTDMCGIVIASSLVSCPFVLQNYCPLAACV